MLDQKCFCQIFIKFNWKQMCFSQYFNMCMETFYQNSVFLLKFVIKFYWNQCVSVNILICTWQISTETKCFNRNTRARTVLDQKCFCHFFIMVYQNKCVSVSIFICARINSTKTLCFGRKNSKMCAWSKVFLSNFHKFLLKHMCFQSIF